MLHVLLGIIFGGFLGFLSAYFQEKGKNKAQLEGIHRITELTEDVRTKISLQGQSINRREELKAKAYADFYQGIASITIAQKTMDDEMEKEANSLLADAKARIAMYGDAEVACKLGRFFKDHANLCTPQAMQSFVVAIYAMRKDICRADDDEGKIDMNILANLTLGCDLFEQNLPRSN